MKRITTLLFGFILLATIAKAQYAAIPDSNFRAFLVGKYPACFNALQQMDTTCSGVTTEYSLNCNNLLIKDLTGIQYFDNLQFLDCSNNQLKSLPALPGNIRYLACANNQLANLPSFTNNSSLSYLYCSGNKLSTLSALPNSLVFLECQDDSLTSIPTLPNTNLASFICDGNQLDSLPSLPDSLSFVFCNNNQLGSLPSLPVNLNYLGCNGNKLTTLSSLPAFLKYLYCNRNQLTSLPNLPAGLGYLYCANNQLSYLPSLPDSLVYLKCKANSSLACLPVLPGKLASLVLDSVTLHCIPNQVANLQIAQDTDNAIIQMPICNPTNNANQCRAYPTIIGKVFGDNNSNGIKDKNEHYLPYIRVALSTGQSAYTNNVGQFIISTPDTGSFSLVTKPPRFYKAVPDTNNVTFTGYNSTLTLADIALQPTLIKDSLFVHIYPLETAIPGERILYAVADRNIGTTSLNAIGSFTYDTSKLVFDSASVPLISHAGNTLVWQDTLNAGYFESYANTYGFHFPYFRFKVKTTAVLGDSLAVSATITSATATAAANNTIAVKSSYDPNSKNATPQLSSTQVFNGADIDYVIHFQNVGAAFAKNIVIADTLSQLLNQGVLQMVAFSHNPAITIGNGIIYFEFKGVNLPDSNTDQLKSNGFVHFKVKPQTTVSLGSSIDNQAAIYFDYNTPVLTNIASTIIKNPVLPVRIASYELQLLADNSVENIWVTSSEINTAYFNLQRSIDGNSFATIGKVLAKGNGLYEFTDMHAKSSVAGSKRYYRLQILDKDGSISYSDTKSISILPTPLGIGIYPNPAKDFICIYGKNIAKISIIDNMGKVVATKAGLDMLAEQNKVSFSLAPGVYIAQIATVDGKIVNKKFVVE
ncbi:T9SS type A sorting domain-containing protein [Parasediminibacterium sp. JCM 36343]|uniref:DUF7619 domain-containing protein n=1 Tax=Parasediminibacterium sp. JCM 36343 TaxID=3374279 RepID=UPI00397CB157